LIKHIFPNFFRLGLIQLFSILLQFLLIPVVVSRAGITENGKLLTALSIAVLFSILINYGTSQSGPLARPTAIGLLLALRSILFLGVSAFFLLLYFFEVAFSFFLLGTLPILLAEVLNPYVLCIGADRLRILAWLNFFGRLLGFLLVYYGWTNAAAAYWVNAYVGAGLVMVFLLFWVYEFVKGRLRWEPISVKAIYQLGQTNFPLLLSNLLVHLQQSLVLYSIGAVAGGSVLGIYAIIDKLIWGFRMILTSFSGAVLARALHLYKEGQAAWLLFRQRINRLLALGLLLAAAILVAGAQPLAVLLAKGADEQMLATAIRLAALIPLVTALNLLNVLELLLEKQFRLLNRINFYIFLVVTLLCAILLGLRWMQIDILFWMPIVLLFLIETITLLFYEKNRHHSR
jgi:O-antigen/teichoic acid export membrane protein